MLCATKGEYSNRLSPPLANLAPLPTSPGQHLPPASRKSFEIVSLKDQHVPTPGRASNTRLKSPPGARHPQLCTQSLPQPSTAELFCFLCWFLVMAVCRNHSHRHQFVQHKVQPHPRQCLHPHMDPASPTHGRAPWAPCCALGLVQRRVLPEAPSI